MGHHRATRAGSRRRTDETTLQTPRPVAQPTAGKRRATKPARSAHTGSRGPLFRSLPSVPVVAGTATLVIALTGAAQMSSDVVTPTASHPTSTTAHANAMSGVSTSASVDLLSGRGPIVSRSSSRETLGTAANGKLKSAAQRQYQERNAALSQFRAKIEKQAKVIEANAWVLPLAGYRLSAFFGASSYLWSSVHTGLDFSAPSGTPIHAVAGGTVTEVGWDGSYGNKTVVTLEDGTEIWYAHQTSFAVSVGDVVRSGDLLGYVGSTGNSTGPHLHLEVRPGGGDPVDPYAALQVHGLHP